MADLYKQDGVDVSEGDLFSRFAADICRASYGNSPYVDVGDLSRNHFRGPRGAKFQNLPDGYFNAYAPDGIGTKSIVITNAMTHRLAARDLVAMCCGDITRWGGMPLVFSNVLDVSSLGRQGDEKNNAFRELMSGLGDVAKELKIVLMGGETAELGVCVGSENPNALTEFNWAGVAHGVYHPKKMILGDTLKPGQAIMALKENGFRSNGISSVRKALQQNFCKNWYHNPNAREAVQAAAEPSVLYDPFLVWLNGWDGWAQPRIKVHLIVHVTGGAIRSKLAEDILFPRGLSADLHNLWQPPEIMRQCAQWRGMDDNDCYETWNCGQGALVVIDEDDVNRFTVEAKMFNIQACLCGHITQNTTPEVKITSTFSSKEIFYRST